MHLSSAWSSLVSWFSDHKSLCKQNREARSTIALLRRELKKSRESIAVLEDDNTHLAAELASSQRKNALLESKIEVADQEVELLGDVIERNIERVRAESAQYSFAKRRILEGEEVDAEEM